MYRSTGDMAAPPLLPPRLLLPLAAALSLFAACSAGPLGPLPNVTSADLGLQEGGCVVGGVVYLPGDELPGASACERCRCAGAGSVSCTRTRCEPRPGCKALHRPDHCCPTYQCECEQEGRVYGNGEKLVDPADPCRVCYCQGGEVVCRRIACFLRDDCSPRRVPGRCCPEYDNCPLRGVTAVSGVSPSISTVEDIGSSLVPTPPKENIKQEITIKEITPVSEIPIIPEVKIKEILPTPGFEVSDYSSSKSPMIVREATSENIVTSNVDSRTEKSVIVELQPSASSAQPVVSAEIPTSPTKLSGSYVDTQTTNDATPSKISLSTQDSINNEMYPSIATSISTMESSPSTSNVAPLPATTRAPAVEEEDSSLFDHNPAFPPLPDDLSVLSNHEDELLPDQIDSEHVLVHEATSEAVESHNESDIKTTAATVAISFTAGNAISANSKAIPETTPEVAFVATETSPYLTTEFDHGAVKTASPASTPSQINVASTAKLETTFSTNTMKGKDSPMLNLRSAIPTEILDVPSSVPEEIDGKPDNATDSSPASSEIVSTETFVATENIVKEVEKFTNMPELLEKVTMTPALQVTTRVDVTTSKAPDTTIYLSSTQALPDQTPNPEAKSNIVTEITAQTEFSSLPIETSDQKPKENSENIEKVTLIASTVNPSLVDFTTTKVSTPTESEVITVSRSSPPSTDSQSGENVETTEFVISSFGSSESATDAVELIKISAEPEISAEIIQSHHGKKNSVLTDLINLVGDVAAIGHTDAPELERHAPAGSAETAAAPAGISESEELIPVNAGYKSKNSNWNLNSITEVPIKSKGSPPVSKQKVVELEDEEAESITDNPPPNDKVEPTTRRPIIDNVSDDTRPDNRTEKKDIEIITKSYVPSFNRRPTKVVMKKSNEQPVTGEMSTETDGTTVPTVVTTASGTAAASETVATPPAAAANTATTAAPAKVSPDPSSTSTH